MTPDVQKHNEALERIRHSGTGPLSLVELSELGFIARPKGIYKPKGSKYALSVRRTIGSPYDDPPPFVEGTEFTAVYREERWHNGKPPFTVRALFANQSDMIPLAYFNEVPNPEPGASHRLFRLTGLAIIVDYQEGWFFLKGKHTTATA